MNAPMCDYSNSLEAHSAVEGDGTLHILIAIYGSRHYTVHFSLASMHLCATHVRVRMPLAVPVQYPSLLQQVPAPQLQCVFTHFSNMQDFLDCFLRISRIVIWPNTVGALKAIDIPHALGGKLASDKHARLGSILSGCTLVDSRMNIGSSNVATQSNITRSVTPRD